MLHPSRVLSAMALLAGASGCGNAPEPASTEQGRGERLYSEWNCGACHGESRQGSEFGPPLTGLAEHWSEEALAAFVADPDAAPLASPRLQQMQGRFPAPMPAFREPEDDRRVLAAWLLRQEPP